ncbi:MAG: SHOCT domain-containing protein [Peptostreptococcaceae bacterium]
MSALKSGFKSAKAIRTEFENANIDRSVNIFDKIGGADNIDVNLSKYCSENQLLVLKDDTIHIGYNDYEFEKIISFDDIIKIEIRVNDAQRGTASEYTENTVKKIINSIFVYIHTKEYTEELVFKYSAYDDDQAQVNYNEILKGLQRLKVLIKDTDEDTLNKESSTNTTKKSIPEQLKEYKELLDMNIITEEEFETKKKELLNS